MKKSSPVRAMSGHTSILDRLKNMFSSLKYSISPEPNKKPSRALVGGKLAKKVRDKTLGHCNSSGIVARAYQGLERNRNLARLANKGVVPNVELQSKA